MTLSITSQHFTDKVTRMSSKTNSTRVTKIKRNLTQAREKLIEAAELYDREVGPSREIEVIEHGRVTVKKGGDTRLVANALKVTIKAVKSPYTIMHEQLANQDDRGLPLWIKEGTGRVSANMQPSKAGSELPEWMEEQEKTLPIEEVKTKNKSTQAGLVDQDSSRTDRWALTWLTGQLKSKRREQYEEIKQACWMDPNNRQPVMRKIDRLEKDAFVIQKLSDKVSGKLVERKIAKAATLVCEYRESMEARQVSQDIRNTSTLPKK